MSNPTAGAPCEWAQIKEPDTRYNKDGGTYQITLVFNKTNPEHLASLRLIQVEYKKAVQEAALKNKILGSKPWTVDTEDTNLIRVKFSQKRFAQGRDGKFEIIPTVFDGNGNVVTDIPLMGNGSMISVQWAPHPYDLQGGGLRLQPIALQIQSLVEYTPEAKAENPFAKVNGGYVAPVAPVFGNTQGVDGTKETPVIEDDFKSELDNTTHLTDAVVYTDDDILDF